MYIHYFWRLTFTFKCTNMDMNLTTTNCIVSTVSEISTIRYRHTCKNILLALICSIAVDTVFDDSLAILVMVTVDAGFLWGYEPISSIRSTLALHLTFRFRLSMNIDKLALGVACLTYLLIGLW